MSHKKDAEPPKLMPLEEFKKFVQAIARVPKEKVDNIERSQPQRPQPKDQP